MTVSDLADALKAHRGLNTDERQFFNDVQLVVQVVLSDQIHRLERVEQEQAQHVGDRRLHGG